MRESTPEPAPAVRALLVPGPQTSVPDRCRSRCGNRREGDAAPAGTIDARSCRTRLRNEALGAGHSERGLHPARLGSGHVAAEIGEAVIPPAFVVERRIRPYVAF